MKIIKQKNRKTKKSEIKEINKFIMKRPYYLWYVKNLDTVPETSVVEAVLNCGTMDEVNEMIDILGMKKVKKIFREQTKYKRNNYHQEVINYFRLFFRKYAA